jgi:AAA domain
MRICIYGGPGIGKSKLAAWLYTSLSMKVELVTEYVKSWAYEGRLPTSYDQLYLFAKQLRAEDLLIRKGLHLVTDSPLPLQLIYAQRQQLPYYDELYKICKKFDKTHPYCNVSLKRVVPYSQYGRFETEEEAKVIDMAILKLLHKYDRTVLWFDPVKDKQEILEYCENCLKWDKK